MWNGSPPEQNRTALTCHLPVPVSIVLVVVVVGWLILSLESQQAAKVNLSWALSGSFCSRRSSFYAALLSVHALVSSQPTHSLYVCICVCLLKCVCMCCLSYTPFAAVLQPHDTCHTHTLTHTHTLPCHTQSVTLHSTLRIQILCVPFMQQHQKAAKQNPHPVVTSSASFLAAFFFHVGE